ncbi:hypothetical protein LIER_14335 [Lithospermum erythrorhizon]|uniref:Uncharacterized protein n=1 Tax=Lithospermum erythrorhizon TaxID=34254 RepID=A0AAV3PZ91_LITER
MFPSTSVLNYTTLELEDFEATQAEFQTLVDGFPKPLNLKTFCDPDVVIKADKLLLFKLDTALTPSQVNYKAIVSGAFLIQQVLRSNDSNLQEEDPEPPERLEAPMPEKPLEEPIDSSPIQCIWYPGKPNQGKPSSPLHSPDHSMDFKPIGSEEGYKSDHPYFVDNPYVLPSGVEVTDDFVSCPVHS